MMLRLWPRASDGAPCVGAYIVCVRVDVPLRRPAWSSSCVPRGVVAPGAYLLLRWTAASRKRAREELPRGRSHEADGVADD
eukprot:3566770-Alexandrium_andersonii.AAC.1